MKLHNVSQFVFFISQLDVAFDCLYTWHYYVSDMSCHMGKVFSHFFFQKNLWIFFLWLCLNNHLKFYTYVQNASKIYNNQVNWSLWQIFFCSQFFLSLSSSSSSSSSSKTLVLNHVAGIKQAIWSKNLHYRDCKVSPLSYIDCLREGQNLHEPLLDRAIQSNRKVKIHIYIPSINWRSDVANRCLALLCVSIPILLWFKKNISILMCTLNHYMQETLLQS